MTQKRLFLLTEGGRPGYVEISTFRDIEVSMKGNCYHCLYDYEHRPDSVLLTSFSHKLRTLMNVTQSMSTAVGNAPKKKAIND